MWPERRLHPLQWGGLRREAHRRELAAQRALLLERERDLQVQHLLLQLPLLRGEDRPLLLLSRARQLGGVAQVTQAGWRLRTQESGRALELQITWATFEKTLLTILRREQTAQRPGPRCGGGVACSAIMRLVRKPVCVRGDGGRSTLIGRRATPGTRLRRARRPPPAAAALPRLAAGAAARRRAPSWRGRRRRRTCPPPGT